MFGQDANGVAVEQFANGIGINHVSNTLGKSSVRFGKGLSEGEFLLAIPKMLLTRWDTIAVTTMLEAPTGR